ncbi:MAG: hypothetical protein ACYSYV_08985 [Planctomycetota bacterium]|jgi:hypothetical protein
MKTASHNTLIKTICILLIVLTSASLVEAYPPDNAAVLYYKAFLVMKEPSKDVKEMFNDLRDGRIKSNDEIRQCFKENRHAIELLETAAEIPNCDWGRDDSKGFDLLLPELGKIRQMAFLLDAKAKILSENGEYKAALNKCLTLHKMARHVGDDLLISYLVSAALNTMANKRIEDFLSRMPDDLETLAWLKNRIVGISSNVTSVKTAMNREKEICLHNIQKDKIDELLETMGDEELNNTAGADAIEKVRKGDDKFFRDSRSYYANVMSDMIVALDLPYPQSHKILEQLYDRIEKEAKENPVAITTAILMPAVARVHTLGIKNLTFFNAITVAIDMYIVKAKTGRLPDTLPAGLPRDLFSGKDFEYEKTKDGFILRCRGKDLDKDEIFKYEFKIPK